MLSIGSLLADRDFAQAFTVLRSSGTFGLGGWQNTTTSLTASGAISAANDSDLAQVEGGDRVVGALTVYTVSQLYLTNNSGAGAEGLSDVIVWRGQQYRVVKLWTYADYGYYKAIAARMAGE